MLENKVLLVGREEDKGPARILNKDKMKYVDMLSVPESRDMSECFMKLPSAGEIFVKHPELDYYILDDANLDLNIYRTSLDAIFHFVALLNASNCKYAVEIINKKQIKVKSDTKANTPAASGELHVENTNEKTLHQQLNKEYQGKGSHYLTKEEYERACLFFENHPILKYNNDARLLLDKRNPDYPDQAGKLMMNISQDYNMDNELQIAASLSKLKGLTISSNLGVKKSLEKKVFISFEVTFPD